MSLSRFYTVDESEEGIRLPLYDKVGDKTEEWLQVRGVDSPVFSNAKLEADRKTLELTKETDDKKRFDKLLEIKRRLIASLVKDWSEDFRKEIGEPTVDNVAKFFSKAPKVMDDVDRLAGNRSVFFSLKAKHSLNGLESKQS